MSAAGGVAGAAGSNGRRIDLGLFTDSVPRLTFEAALDLAVDVGATAIEIAVGGVSEMTHADTAALLTDPVARSRKT